MFVRLIEPCSVTAANNWMLTAEELDDPAGWSRFHPFTSEDSERTRFERCVREQPLHPKPALCKTLLRAGLSVFEYDWELCDDAILEHAMAVAEYFGVELAVGGNPFKGNRAA
jgi:hypothetical protein